EGRRAASHLAFDQAGAARLGGAPGACPGRFRTAPSPPRVRAGVRAQGGGAAADAGRRLPGGHPAGAQRTRYRKTLTKRAPTGALFCFSAVARRIPCAEGACMYAARRAGIVPTAGQKGFRPVTETPTLGADCQVPRSGADRIPPLSGARQAASDKFTQSSRKGEETSWVGEHSFCSLH